ncbi:MAG: hypothetical protein ACSLE5_14245, partial [Porticoccaceae bacterium]
VLGKQQQGGRQPAIDADYPDRQLRVIFKSESSIPKMIREASLLASIPLDLTRKTGTVILGACPI